MKDRVDAILRPTQAGYLDGLLPDRDPILREMEELAAADGVPISDAEVGRILGILARATGARRIVEVGTAIGYGALCLARGAPAAQVVSIDTDPARLEIGRRFLTRAGVADRVELREGAALEVLPTLDGPFDLAYVDAVKTEYRQYLELLVPRMALGGLVVMDNLLWKGRVADPSLAVAGDDNAAALRDFNSYLTGHPQLEALVLPLGDGLGLATRIA